MTDYSYLETPGLIYQDIFEKLWAESKKQNLSSTSIRSIISEYDTERLGTIFFDDFKFALENRLKIKNMRLLDLKVLAKRYKAPPQRGSTEELVLYEKFFSDYDRFEQMGIKAGYDPLKKDPAPYGLLG